MCVGVLHLVGNDFELNSNTPDSQYHPVSPQWNQHGGVVIGRNVLLLQVFCAATIFGTNPFPIREVPDNGWWCRLTGGKGQEFSFWAAALRVFLHIYASQSSIFCSIYLRTQKNIRNYHYIRHSFFSFLILVSFLFLFTCVSGFVVVWWELMTGVSRAEMSDQMLCQHDHEPDQCWWIMNTTHLNSNL